MQPSRLFSFILFIGLISIYSTCNNAETVAGKEPLSPMQISARFTPKEIYYELYKREKKMAADTIGGKINSIYSKDELRKTSQNSRELADVKTDTLFWVYQKMVPKAIYGIDTRKDVKDATNIQVKNSANKVCALIEKRFLIKVSDSTYQLTTKGTLQSVFNVCNVTGYHERFVSQEVVANCSGVAVSKTQVATAGHCINEANFMNFLLLFDFVITPSNSQLNKVINVKNVYEITGVSAIQGGDAFNNDFRIVTVSKPIPKQRIAVYRKTGKISASESVYVIGTPKGLPLKVADSSRVVLNDPVAFFKINSDTYKGNSGSPVFNAKTHVLEGILVRGEEDFDYLTSANDCRYSIRCPELGCIGEDVMRISRFQNLIKQ